MVQKLPPDSVSGVERVTSPPPPAYDAAPATTTAAPASAIHQDSLYADSPVGHQNHQASSYAHGGPATQSSFPPLQAAQPTQPQSAFPPMAQVSNASQPTGHFQGYHQQQPRATQGMSIADASTLNSMNKPLKQNGQRDWSFGLCGCFSDCGTCCLAWCCPCLQYGVNQSRLHHLRDSNSPHPNGGDAVNMDCIIYCIAIHFGVPCIIQMMGRRDTRRRYAIEGGGCGDCCTSCWCGPCALVQESRELGAEEKALMGSQGQFRNPQTQPTL